MLNSRKINFTIFAFPHYIRDFSMPTISMFYGIIIRMYALDNKQHHLPHIHVEYAEAEAVFQIPDGELLEGTLPNKQYKLV